MNAFDLKFIAGICAFALTGILATPRVIAQEIEDYYTVQHPKEFTIDWGSFYRQANERTAQTQKELPHYLNIPYGKDVKQQLDLYLPKDKPTNAPVFLFLHGGGFREGDRAQYGFIAAPFAKRGVITAVASYRLTGKGFHYPDQPNDVKDALRWLYNNIAQYGGDPDHIVVGGHSAGAILSADVGVNRGWMEARGIPKAALKGFIAVSAPYDMRVTGRPGEQSAYAPTPKLQAEASPLLHVVDPVPSVIISVGSTEQFVESSRLLTQALKEHGVPVSLLILPGEDHKDTVLSLADENSPLFKAALELITQGK